MTEQSLESKTELKKELARLRRRVAELEAVETARRDAQQAFYESENRYRSVFENTGTATIIIEHDMSISMVNAQFVKISGYSRKEIEHRMSWTDFVVPDDIDRMKAYHAKRRQDSSAAPKEYECRVRNRFGDVVHMHVRIDMIEGTMSSVASFMDVTAFKQAEAALKESERKLSKLMSHLPGMAYRSKNDDRRRLIFASDGSTGLTGYGPDELVNNDDFAFNSIVVVDDRRRVRQTIREMIGTDGAFQMEYRIKSADGQVKWVWDEGVGVIGSDGRIEAIEGFVSDITEHKREEQQLRQENLRLKSSIQERFRFGDIIGKNQAMQGVYERISRAGGSDANVMIYGESGTGKELVARAIHLSSRRSDAAFVPVNCSAIPEGLFESEFFGYRKGAFTGAVADKPGFFDRANGGTLFLDELGEIDANTQVKLLRVIEGSGYTPVGGQEIKPADVRIIGATNRDLKAELREGGMREDFFYRIHIIPITLPPLRSRKDDLPLLIDHFMAQYAGDDKGAMIPGNVLEALYNYDWPGNVRELQNVLQRYVTLNTLDFMGPGHTESTASPAGWGEDGPDCPDGLGQALDRHEKGLIVKTLEQQRWHKGRTAAVLGVNRKTLFRKMKKHSLI
ncbi:MAG: sigma 54-interacting transcriptional regulator [Thermodesulfobacteriota bacterium]